jgi:hypothetical protein
MLDGSLDAGCGFTLLAWPDATPLAYRHRGQPPHPTLARVASMGGRPLGFG